MSGTPVAIGPWTGGLNLKEEPQFIADNELQECINFDIGRAGELTSRPGVKAVRTLFNRIHPSTNPIALVGSAVKPDGTSRLFAKIETAPGVWTICYTDTPESPDVTWLTFPTYGHTSPTQMGNVKAMFTARYDPVNLSFAWFIPYGPGALGAVHPLEGNFDLINGTGGIPRGSGCLVFKNRLFVYGAMDDTHAGTYRIYYSAVGNYTSFPVNNFFDVGPGDGDFVAHIAIQGDALVIFKVNSTWSLFFESDPFLGTLRKVNNEIGAVNGNCVVSYQNELYVISRRGVHRLTSLLFEEIGKNLNLYAIRSAHKGNDFIASVGDKIICCIDTGQVGTATTRRYRYFVYYTETNIWSEYVFTFEVKQIVNYLDFQHSLHQFITGVQDANLYHMHPTDKSEQNAGDYPNDTTYYSMMTKRYDYGSYTGYKRMFWWAIEAIGNKDKPFTMQINTENSRFSQLKTFTPKGAFVQIIKAFVPARFRLVTYIIRCSAPNALLRFGRGEANVALKKEVNSGYPIEKA